MLQKQLQKLALDALSALRVAKPFAPFWGGMGAIFCLHHVLPGGGLQTGFAPNSNLEITPEFLDELITTAKSLDYELISMTEAVRRVQSKSSGKRFAVFTLDDGYKDNLVHAMPVFRQHNCPFTVYVAPRIADGTCELWWRVLELVIASSNTLSLELDHLEFTLDVSTEASKWQAWRSLAPRVQAMPEYEQRAWMTKTAHDHGVDLQAYCRSVAMTWDALQAMARDPLVTIGAHTLNHYNLLKLSEADARREIVESGKRIEAELGRKIEHFAYPYGNKDAAGPREFKLAKDAGYKTAVVTRLGPLVPGHADHLHALPRLMVSGKYQKPRYIKTLMSGVPSQLSNGLRALNVD
jgi:peptidoglycan/xylan/chitin deacetylase (PgdA/CDA1 family)